MWLGLESTMVILVVPVATSRAYARRSRFAMIVPAVPAPRITIRVIAPCPRNCITALLCSYIMLGLWRPAHQASAFNGVRGTLTRCRCDRREILNEPGV